MKKKLTRIKHWYERYERRISLGSLLTGFFVDALTLQRIDALRENLWIAGNILLVAVSIILINRGKSEKRSFWFGNILQFGFGALLGSFFIFYFRSTTLSATWPFIAVLLFAMVMNELFQRRYAKLAFQLSFFYFSLFSFLIFLVPLMIGQIGPEAFVLSGILSLFAIYVYMHLLRAFATEKFLEEKTRVWTFVWAVFLGINVLYFTNLIPPIPLSMKDAGVYHSITKTPSGRYLVEEERRGIIERYLPLKPAVHWQEGKPLYVYTAIFSPGLIHADVVHEWQYKKENGEWETATRIPLTLSGGRAGGFRTFSHKFNFTPGLWRVDVKTKNGQLIGRVSFRITPASEPPALVTSER